MVPRRQSPRPQVRAGRPARLRRPVAVVGLAVVAGACWFGVARADSVESTTGAVIQGKVVARDDKSVTLEVQVGGKPVQRKYPLNLVRAVTVDGKREVLQGGGAPAAVAPPPGPGGAVQQTRPQVEALIAQAAAKPDWLDATPLNLPKSLDLTWPEKPQGPWNNQKNVGQFVWDVINPNPNRWREGVKLMHHLMDQNPADKELRSRACQTLGGMYHHLFQDYARSAYWLRQAGTRGDPVALAECYWKLGNKQMAVESMNGIKAVPVSAIKLWADMGETARALQLVDPFVRGGQPDMAYLYAGDACRQAGRVAEAVKYYEKVVALPDDNRNKRNKDRARGGLEQVKLFDAFDLKKVADGTYADSSLGYEGPVEVSVKVQAGRIEEVTVTKHKEKQFYAALTETPAAIIRKQSVKGVDATSRATITSEAIITATAKALQSGAKP